MFSYSLSYFVLCFLAIGYALPYANYEWKQKNKAGAILIYLIALCLIFLVIF